MRAASGAHFLYRFEFARLGRYLLGRIDIGAAMLNLLKTWLQGPTPSGPTETLAEFKPETAQPIDGSIELEDGSWKLKLPSDGSVPFFQLPLPEGNDSCRLTYRMRIKTELESGDCYLEMWCRLPESGKFFSKGLHDRIGGKTDWSGHEIPFMLKKGQVTDQLDLNLYGNGKGTVWVDKIEVLKSPLA
ncbi:MAG: hypothetical protein ACR2O1_11785 [Boseongicola sp.]